MTPERWIQLERVFHEALEQPQADRRAFLDRACADDPGLRAEVESLLAQESEQTKIDHAVAAAAHSLFEQEIHGDTGRRVGPYQLIREIGQGGMGSVYVALRTDDQYMQTVAVKLIRAGLGSDFLLQRFRHERQILANLNHPNIARLLDGGTTEDGRPYLVMEYIDGQPVVDWCESRGISLTERIELFRQICSAVQHAHQNLVIHRDIKPGNILVTADGQPKLLDFGIAKLLVPELVPGAPPETVTSMRMLTPDYCSPEQLRGEPITTASDVYSLGVLLYEMLAGKRPYQVTGTSLIDIERAICLDDPPAPSQSTGKTRFLRQLSGDLDNIVLMAMRKETTRRYQSVEQLSADLERYLRSEPVLARKDTLLYRAGKFARRNRISLAAGMFAALSLSAGTVFSVYQARRADQRFQEVRQLANTFLFDFHDKIRDLPGSTEARELVVRTALEYLRRLEKDSSRDPDLQLELANAYLKVGAVQGDPRAANLGHVQEAIASLEKGTGLARALTVHDPTDLRYFRTLAEAESSLGDLLVISGESARGVAELRRSVEAWKVVYAASSDPKDLQGLGGSCNRLGDALIAENPGAALDVYQLGLKAVQTWVQKDESAASQNALARTYERLGRASHERGDPVEAISSYRKAAEICEKLLAKSPDNTAYRRELAIIYQFLANLSGNDNYFSLGDRKSALEYFEKAEILSRRVAAADPKNMQARVDLILLHNKIGNVLRHTDHAAAAARYRLCLQGFDDLLASAPGHVYYLRGRSAVLSDYGSLMVETRDFSRASRVFDESALTLAEAAAKLPADDLGVLESRLMLFASRGELAAAQGRYAEATELFRRSLELAEPAHNRNPADLYFRRDLADVYRSMGKLEESRRRPGEACKWYRKSLGLWERWPDYAVSSPFNQARRKELQGDIVRCAGSA